MDARGSFPIHSSMGKEFKGVQARVNTMQTGSHLLINDRCGCELFADSIAVISAASLQVGTDWQELMPTLDAAQDPVNAPAEMRIGTEYIIEPPNIDGQSLKYSIFGRLIPDDFVEYTIEFKKGIDSNGQEYDQRYGNPERLCVDPETGKVSGSPKNAGNYVALLKAKNKGADTFVRTCDDLVGLDEDLVALKDQCNTGELQAIGMAAEANEASSQVVVWKWSFEVVTDDLGIVGGSKVWRFPFGADTSSDVGESDIDSSSNAGSSDDIQEQLQALCSQEDSGCMVGPTTDSTNLNITLAVNKPLQLGAVDTKSLNFEGRRPDNFTYVIEGAPKGFFIDPSTGEVQGTPRSAMSTVTIVLIVQDSASKSRVAEIGRFDFEVADYVDEVQARSRSSKGEICNGHGKIAKDDDPFDGFVKCKCDSEYGGDYCNVNHTLIAVMSLAGVVLVLVLLASIYRYNAVAAKRAAHNFHAELEEMLAEGEIEPDQVGAQQAIPREIKRSCVQLTDAIGEGAFGQVFKGLLDESAHGGVPAYLAAIKMVSDDAPEEAYSELFREVCCCCCYRCGYRCCSSRFFHYGWRSFLTFHPSTCAY